MTTIGRRLGVAAAATLLVLVATRALAERPNVVFVLLDTTRADRLGAFGNPRPTTPALDALAARGVLFTRHYANAHATRPSFPQLFSGRYYHQNVLRVFAPREHPREFPFSVPDPDAALLPDVLRRNGWATLGASAHPWVVAESELGRGFDRLDFVAGEASRGHADAAEVVDRAALLWRGRDPARATFLYVHLMDMHVPRYLPAGEPRFPVEGFDWRRRFDAAGEPLFGHDLRRWSDPDAGDFTAEDRLHFAAVYDTRLAYTDEHLGRLFRELAIGDPELRRTLVVVVADHGEELGEDGRRGHFDSLAEGVQHIPWIVAGAGIPPAQRAEGRTENVDVVPTLLSLLALPPASGADGRAQLGADGRVCATCAKASVYHVWEEYRAIRAGRYVLREEIPGSFRARCDGPATLYRLDGPRRVALDRHGREQRRVARLQERLARRLDAREQAFLTTRYGPAEEAFVVRPRYWRLETDAVVACVPVGPATERGAFGLDGWTWTGRGVAIFHGDAVAPLPVTLLVPDGDYRVDAAGVPIEAPPWFSHFARWRRRSFLPEAPTTHARLGTFRAANGRLSVAIPAAAGRGTHIVGLRLTPLGAEPAPPGGDTGGQDPELRKRLKALGYVE
ncbi:MAG TPA: sulfatase [Candidatus Binatia bacterium]|nr:sulfatase [Candidatus Binatia bacterium]